LVYSTLCFGTQGFFGVLSTKCSFNWCYIFLLLIKTSIVFMVFKTLYGKSVCSCSFSLSPFQIKKMTSLICDVSCYHSFILTTTSILDKYHNRYETLYDPRILVFLRYLRSHVRLRCSERIRFLRHYMESIWMFRNDDLFSEDCTSLG